MSSKKSKKRMGSTRRHHQGPKTEEKEGNAELQESSSAEHLQPSEMPKGQLDSVPENQEGDQHDAKQMCSEKSETDALAELCEAETIAPGKKRRMGSTRRAKQEHQVVEKKEEEEKEDEGMQIIQEEFNTTEDQRLKESSNTTEVVLDEALTQLPEGWSKVKAEMTEDVSPNDEQHSFVSGLNLKTETEACSTENPSPGVNLIVSVAGIHPNEEKAVFDAKEISPNETRLQDTSQGLAQQTEEHAEVSEREEPWWGKNDFESNTERVDMESISVEGDNKQDVSLRQESRERMQIEKEDDDSVRKMEVECAGVQDFSLQMQDTTQIRELPSTESQLLVEGHSKPSDASADGTEMKGYTMSGNENNLETEQIGSVSISQGEAKNSQYHQKPKKRMGSTRRPLKEPKEMEEDIGNNQVVTQEIRENIIQDPNMAKDDMQVREMAFTMSIRGEDLEGAVDVTEKEKNKQDFPDENTGKDTEACPSNEFLTDDDATTSTTTSVDQERSLMEEMLHTELFKALEPSTNMDFLEQAPPLVDPSPDYIETTIENPERMDSASHQVDFGTLREASDSFEQGHLSSSPTSHDSPGIVVAPPNVHAESSSLTMYHSDVKHNEEEEHGTQSHILSDPMESESASISTDVLDFGSHSVHAEITDTTETSTFTDYEFSFKLQHHEEEEDVKQGVSSQKRRMGSTRRTKREHKMEETCEAVIVKGENINEVVNMNIDSDLSTEAKGDTDTLRETGLENIDTSCTAPTLFGQDEGIDKSTATETTFPQCNVQEDGQDNQHEYTDTDITTEQLDDDDLKEEISILSKETAEVVTNQINVEMNSPNVQQCKEEEQWAQFHIVSSTSDLSNICTVTSDFSHSIHLESSSTDVLEAGSHSLHAESIDPTETNTFPDHSESSIKHHAEEEGVTLGGSKQKRRMGSTRRTKREHKMGETRDVVTTEGEDATEDMNMKTDSDLKAEAEVDVIGASQEKEFVTSQIEVETLSATLTPIEQCQDIDSSPDCSASTVEGRDAIEKTESFSCQMGVETLTCLESLTSSSLDQTTEIAIMTQNMHSENFNIEMLRPDVQHSEETEQRTQVPLLSSTVESEVSIAADVPDFSHSLDHVEEDSAKQSASRQKRRMGSTRRTKREQKMEETLNTEGDNATENMNMNIDADLRTETGGDVLKVDIILLASEETELVTSQTNVETVGMVSSPNEEDQYANSNKSLETFSLYSPREDELKQENQHQCPDINTEQLDVNDLKGDEMSIQETVEAITTVGADIPNEGSMSEDGDKFKKHEDEKQEKSFESLGHQSMEDIKMEVSEQAVDNMISSSRENLSPNCSATIVENIDISEKSESFSCQITVDALTSLGSSTTLDPFPETAVTCQNVCIEVNTPDVQHSDEAEQGTQAHILSSTMESVESSISMDVSVSDFSHSLAIESTFTLGTDTVSEHSESSLTLQHHEEEESVKQGASSQKRRMGSTRRTKREHLMEKTCDVVTAEEENATEDKNMKTDSDLKAEAEVHVIGASQEKEFVTNQIEVETLSATLTPNEQCQDVNSSPDCSASTVEDRYSIESVSCQMGVETLTCHESLTSSLPDQTIEIAIMAQNIHTETLNMLSPDVQHSEETEQRTQVPILSSTVESEVSIAADVPDFSHSLDHEEDDSVKQNASRQKRRMGSTRRTKREQKMEETLNTEGDNATEDMNMNIDADLRTETEGDVLKEDIILASEETELVSSQTNVETVGMVSSPNEEDQYANSSISSETISSFSLYSPREDELMQENQHQCPDINTEQLHVNDLKGDEMSIPRQETVEAITTMGADIPNEGSMSEDGDKFKKHEDEKQEKSLESLGHQSMEDIKMEVSEQAVENMLSSSRATIVDNIDISEKSESFSCQITVDALASLESSTTLDPFPETAVTCQNVCLEVNTPDVQRSEEAEQGTQAHILSSTMESVESSISMDVSVSDFSHSLAVESTLGTDTVSEHSESSLTLQHHEEEESVKQGASSQKRRMGSTRRSKREHKMEETCEIQKETMPEQAEGENELSPMDDPRPNCVATTVEAMDTTEKRESLSFQIDVETLTCLKSPSTHSTDHVPEIVSILQNVQAESSDQDESSFKLQHHEEEETVKVVTNQTDIEKNSSDVQQCEEEQQSVQSQILSATLEVSNVCTVVPDFSHSLHVERTDTSETNTFTDQSESSLKVQHNEEEEGVKLGGSKLKRRMGSTRRTKTEHKMEETCEVVTTEGDATENINMKIDADLRAEVEGDIIDASKGEEFVTTQTDVETQGQDANSNTLDEMVQSSSQCSSLQEDILRQETQHEHHNVISLQDDFKDNNELSTVGKETVIMPVGPEDFNEASIDAHDDQLQIQEEQKSENTLEPQGDQDKGNIISTALAEDETKLSSTAEGPTTVESMDTSESPCEPDTFNMEITNVTESGALSPEQWGSSLRIHPHEKERDSKQDSSKQKRKMGSTRRRKKESDDMHLDGTQSSQATGEITGMVTETDVEMREEEHLLSEQISSSEERQAVNPDTTPVEEFKDYQTQMIETSEETVVEQNEEDMSSNEKTFLSVEVSPEVTICLEAADVDSCTKLQPSSCLPLDNEVNVNPDTDVTCPENSEAIQIENQTKQDQGFTSSESDHLERDLKANPRRKIGSTRRVNRRQVDEINQGKDVVTEETQIILEEDNKGGNILITQEVEVLEAQREEDSGPLETQRGAQNDTIADEWEMIESQTQNTVPEMSVTISQYQETEGSPGLARRRKLGSTRRSRKEQTERKYVVMDGMLMYTDSETNSTDDCKSVDGEVKDKEGRGIHESEEDSEAVPCNTIVSPPDSLKTVQETSNNDKDEQCILVGAITTAEWPPQVGEAGNDNSSVHGDTLAVNIITPPLEASDSSEESKPRKKRMGSSRKISQRRQKDKAESHSEADVRYEVLESVTSAADKQPIEQDTGGTGEADKERLEGPVNDTSTDFHESEYSKPAEQTHTYPEGPAVTGLHEQLHFGKTEISESNENRAAETSFNSTLSADDSVTEPRSMLHKRKMGSSRRGKGLGKRMTDVANVEEHVDDSNTLRQETGDKTALQNTEDLSVEGEHLLLAPQSNESDQQPLTQGETPNELIDERAIPESALGASSASSEPQQDNPSIDTQSSVKKRKMGSTRKNIWRHSDDTTNSNLQREQAPSPERCSDNTATGDIEALPVAAETALTLKMSEVVQPKGISAQKESTGHGSAGHKQDSDSTRRKMGSRRGGQGYRGIGAVGAPENRPVSQGQDDGSLLQGTQEENVPSEDVPEQGPSKQSSQREKNTQSEQPPAGARSKSDLEIRSDQVPTLTSLGEAVMFNIVMVGDSSVGKTSFIRRLEKGQFLPESSATLGVDTSILPLVVDGKLVKLQIWDTAGQERFHSITRQVLHKAQGLILMYDVSSCQTFSAVRKWIACIEDGAPSEVIILLLGNKNDSEDRQVLHPEGKRLAEEYNIHFMECSAATGNNVSQAMETLARLLKETVKEADQQYVSLHKKPQPKKSGCC